MTKIIPFRAVRPKRDKVHLVVSRSYQSYTEDERTSRMNYNPFSFLHIINPGYKYQKETTGEKRYSMVRDRYLEFKEETILQQDQSPCYYIYKIVKRDRSEFIGIIAAASTEDYKNNVIKKHEETIQHRETTFKEYLKKVKFNAEPVLITYPDNEVISTIMDSYTQERPEYEFTTTDRDVHYLWKIEEHTSIQQVQQAFSEIKTMYIADGHHRSASSYLLSEDLKKNNPQHYGDEAYNFFMSYLIPESNLKIYGFNRLIKDLNGMQKEEFLIRLDTWFRIENRKAEVYTPSKSHHFCMYIDGEFYSLYLRKTKYTFQDALEELDAQILYKTVLKPIFDIENLRTDDRIDYVYGKNGSISLKNSVDSGEYQVGFALFPTSTQQLKKIADQGLKMPPKSTYIEPKLRSGIAIYEF